MDAEAETRKAGCLQIAGNGTSIMMFYALIILNIITFFVYGLDKLKAVNHWWRIPEWVLLGLAAAGGSVGAYLGMMVFRHKTLKPLFRFGVPLIMLVHVIVAVYVWK